MSRGLERKKINNNYKVGVIEQILVLDPVK